MNNRVRKFIRTIIWVFSFVIVFLVICTWTGVISQEWINAGNLLSVAIAVIALIISIFTFLSIDTVNAISRMDGNILENEGYRTNLYRMLNDLKDKMDTNNFSSLDLITILKSPFKKRFYSGAQLADKLQSTIDYLVFLPFLVNHETENEKLESEINKTLSLIDKSIKTFNRVNEGSTILINESANLIKGVLNQQFHEFNLSSKKAPAILMPAVRGTMLKNPVSKVVYYDYLGLFYMSKAVNILTKLGASIKTIEGIRKCSKMASPQTIDVIYYLKMAINNFEKGLEVIEHDAMWDAFIYYNIARATAILSILTREEKYDNWKEIFEEAISYRSKLNHLLNDIFVKEHTGIQFFKDAFIAEELLARLTKTQFCIATDIIVPEDYNDDFTKTVKQKIEAHKDFCRLSFPYNDIESFQNKEQNNS